MKIEKESDVLNREYRQNARMMERLSKKCNGADEFYAAVEPIRKRQYQIAKELEECTGVKIIQTEEEILEENKRIQEDRDAVNKRVREAIWNAGYERRQKSLPSKESKFKASSAPGQTTLDMTEDRNKK